MDSAEIRKRFLNFFKERGHVVVPSSSLVPDDPSVLLTTAGMQQFKPYYTGEADPMKSMHPNLGRPLGSFSAASVQKSFRTSDIDEVGDERHCTFFEMLGNFSFGGYFKKEAITYAHEFITKLIELEISYVTIFEGKEDIGVPKDAESEKIWKALDPHIKIVAEGMGDVFWGPTGASGPCGPTTEIYCKNAAGQDIEIWNIVFNEFFFPGSREELNAGAVAKKLERLKTAGVDTGMGLERLSMISQKTKTIFETDLFAPFMELLPAEVPERERRIIVDHLRAAAFLLADGVRPSNKEAGYILRRVMRRAFVYEHIYELEPHIFDAMLHDIVHEYGEFYPELLKGNEMIRQALEHERVQSKEAIKSGINEEDKFLHGKKSIFESKGLNLDALKGGEPKTIGELAFEARQNFGLPFDATIDHLRLSGIEMRDINSSARIFDKRMEEHIKVSAMGAEKKFGGHGLILDTGELKAGSEEELKKVTRLHTATHMLHQALREVLGPEVHQAGSDITALRTRFDFTFPRKVTADELRQIEEIINQKIKEDIPMQKVVLPKNEAEKTGALYFFKEKYPDPVNVYFIGADLEHAWSKEFCGGPHVTHTHEVGKFIILKEEASSRGIRRVRATVEP